MMIGFFLSVFACSLCVCVCVCACESVITKRLCSVKRSVVPPQAVILSYNLPRWRWSQPVNGGAAGQCSVPVCHYRDDIIPLQHLACACTRSHTLLSHKHTHRSIIYYCSVQSPPHTHTLVLDLSFCGQQQLVCVCVCVCVCVWSRSSDKV